MRFLLNGFFVAVAGTVLALPAMAQNASDDLDVTATIVAALSIDCSTAEMDFGQIDPGPDGGTVRLSTRGTQSAEGGTVVLIDDTSGANGACTVSGVADRVVGVDIQDTSVSLTGPGDSMTLNNFSVANGSSPGLPGEYATTLDGNGKTTVNIGAGQKPGDYSGQIEVVVYYN